MVTVWNGVRFGASAFRLIVFDVILGMVAVLGAKAYAVMERGDYSSPLLDFTRELRYPGGLIALVIAAPILARALRPGLSLLRFGDAAAPGVAIGFSIVRVGCFLAGCCFGVPSNLPWAVSFPTPSPALDEQIRVGIVNSHAVKSIPVHPFQLYSAASSALVGMWLLRRNPGKPGEALMLFLFVHEGARFLLEFVRAPVRGHAHLDLKLISLSLSLVGAAVLLRYGWQAYGREREEESQAMG